MPAPLQTPIPVRPRSVPNTLVSCVSFGCSMDVLRKPSWRKPRIDITRVHDASPGPPGKIFQPAPRAMQFRQRLIVTCLVGWAQSSLWVKLGSVPASAARPLLYPQQQTSSGRPGMSPGATNGLIELAGMDRSSLQCSSALRFCGPGHFDGLRLMSMVAISRANLAVIADQPQTRTRRTCQLLPFQKRCVTHSQLPKSSYCPGPAP